LSKGGEVWDQKEVLRSDQTMPRVRSVAHSEDRPWSFDWTLKRKSHLLMYGDVVAKVLACSGSVD
jgi:hypothetical protein